MTGKQEEQPLQKVISDLFRDFKEDETGGQHASRGFNFQVWHAVLEALKAYKTGQDYAVVLEWQQDVAVLDSSTSPRSVRFLQLKKNERSIYWTLNQLSAPEKCDDTPPANDADIGVSNVPGADSANNASAKTGRKAKVKPKKSKPSFLAKLYQHRRRFKDLALLRLEFVSNARFEIADSSGGVKRLHGVELMDLDDKVREDLEKNIRTQLELPADEVIDFTNVGLLVSDPAGPARTPSRRNL